MLRKLTPEKSKVSEAMIFCIEHAEAYEEIIEFIMESLNSVKTSIPKKVIWLSIKRIDFSKKFYNQVILDFSS